MALQDVVNRINLRKQKLKSGLTVEKAVLQEAEMLRECIQSRIEQTTMQDVLTHPKWKDVKIWEDGRWLSAFARVKVIEQNEKYTIFKYANGKDANVFWLLNDGFDVKKVEYFRRFPRRERWIHRDPFHWVEQGIEEYQRKTQFNVTVQVERPAFYYGQDY